MADRVALTFKLIGSKSLGSTKAKVQDLGFKRQRLFCSRVLSFERGFRVQGFKV